MKVSFELNISMTLYHKQTMKELRIDKTIIREYEEDSEEYKKMCELYRDDVGFDREGKENDFDKELLNELCKVSRDVELETIQTIEETFAACYKGVYTGYVRFGGFIINPLDFCAMQVNKFNTSFHKK